MRFGVLTVPRFECTRVLAEGFERMVRKAGCSADIFYDGIDQLATLTPRSHSSFGQRLRSWPARQRAVAMLRRLRSYDCVVMTSTIPLCFLEQFFDDSLVRESIGDTPLVLYSNYYLPTRTDWPDRLATCSQPHGVPPGSHFGLNRFDWYLCTSVVSETPLAGKQHPLSRIGVNIDDGTLYPEQTEWRALLDFERVGFESEREVQIRALEATETPYATLSGNYSFDEIHAIYRATNLFFVAFRESFGLPVAEVQACGSMVLLADPAWCPSHWRKPDLSVPGRGQLNDNFLVYDRSEQRLIEELRRLKRCRPDPRSISKHFKSVDGQFYRGDAQALDDFLSKLEDGTIDSGTHRELPTLKDLG